MTEKEIAELSELSKEFCSGLLNGKSTDDQCFIACAPLVSFLDYSGYNVELMIGQFLLNKDFVDSMKDDERKQLLIEQSYQVNHFWIEIDNNMILDPTADQLHRLYGLPKLKANFVGNKPDWYPIESI